MEKKERKIAKIVIDRNACIGAATCLIESPEAFELDSEGIAILKENALSTDEGRIFIAAQSCPTQAIMLYDENGEQIFPKR